MPQLLHYDLHGDAVAHGDMGFECLLDLLFKNMGH